MVKLAATEVGVLESGRAELTPRPKAARAAKLRFSVAISLICSELISVLTTFESDCTARASASTVTVCDLGTDGELDVDASSLGDVDHDAVLLKGLEALGRDLQVVVGRGSGR